LAGWAAGWLAGLASPRIENFYAAAIEDRDSLRVPTFLTADREPADAPQATAMVPVSNVVATAVVGMPERTDVSAAVTVLADVATADLASPKRMASLAEVAKVDPTSVEKAATDPEFPETPVVLASVPAAEALIDGPPSDSRPPPQRAMRSLGSLLTSDPLKQDPQPAVRPVETPSECPAPEVCIDDYLWALYERTPKIDTNKVVERVKVKAKVTIKRKNKTRTVTKTIIKAHTRYVVGDFTWKDPIAAKKAGMSLKDYVIGGMDPAFKLKLYSALRAMEDAGHMPGITSAFRDDYRQAIASGNKAASDSSYHGGSRRGGYGYGLAADLVSVKGENRSQRHAATQELWKWIDAHEKELGIARPYLDRDPPHVAPLDGAEYAANRGRVIAQKGDMQTKKHDRVAGRNAPTANVPKLSKVSSLEPTPKARERASKKGELQTESRRGLAEKNYSGLAKPAKTAKSSKVSIVQPVPRPRTQERAIH
jgi:hypothetical protein